MLRALLRRREINQLWVIPVYRHPFQKDLVPFATRFQMCRLAFSSLSSRVSVKRIEAQLGGTSYTVRTLRHLTRRYPGTRFQLAVGADSYKNRSKWKDFSKIQELADLIVFDRGKKSMIPDVSSTGIRKGDWQGIPTRVRPYIRKRGLYL